MNYIIINKHLKKIIIYDRKQFEQVFYWHHITKSSFFHSLSYYEQHPDKMKKLIDSLSAYGKRITMHPVDSLKLNK
jgi:hypothetical protein